MAREQQGGESSRWPASTGLLAAYCAAGLVTLVTVMAGGSRHPAVALAVLALAGLGIGTRLTPLTAVGAGPLTWLFYDGFVTGSHAHLGWHGAIDGWALATLTGVALLGAALRGAVRHGPAHTSTAPTHGPAVVIYLAERRQRQNRRAG